MIEIELPSGQVLEIPTNDPDQAKKAAANYWKKNSSLPTQRGKQELGSIDEIGSAPELSEFSKKAFKASLAASLTGGQEEKEIFQKMFPEASFEHDEEGKYLINLPSGTYWLNRPGFSGQDVAEFTTRAGAAMLGGTGAALGKLGFAKVAAQQAGIEGGLQAVEKSLGGEANALDVGVAGVAGAGGEYLGGQITKGLTNVSNIVKKADMPIKETLKMAKEKGLDILATDIVPPNTAIGKFFRGVTEKLGPLGSGSRRAKQQTARIEVTEDLAKSFGLNTDEFDIVAESNIIKDMKSGIIAMKERGAVMRNEAVEALNEFGEVPTDKVVSVIDDAIARELRLKGKANQPLIENLTKTKEAILGGNFEQFKNVRSTVYDDIEAIKGVRPEGLSQSSLAALNRVYSEMSNTAKDFAKKHDRDAAAKWIKSNRIFAEGYGAAKESAMKRLVNKGEDTPELVTSVLKGQKLSDLQRLNGMISENGRRNVQIAVMKKIFTDSGYFQKGANPNRFVTAMDKNKKLVNTFFDGKSKKELLGVKRLLEITERAQDAAFLPETGIQNLYTTGGTVLASSTLGDPLITAFGLGTVSAISKAYESKARRDLLVKLGESGLSSAAENKIINKLFKGAAASTANQDLKSE